MTKLITSFRHFANSPKSVIIPRTFYWQGHTNCGYENAVAAVLGALFRDPQYGTGFVSQVWCLEF
jgi:hypothetical protein